MFRAGPSPISRSSVVMAVCVLATLLPARGYAQSGSANTVAAESIVPLPVAPNVVARDDEGHVTVRATRIAEPIRIDGKLDDPVYDRVRAVDGFIQQDPKEGDPTSEKTEAWVLFDDQNVYITCRCWQDPERIVANEMRRDNTNIAQNDHIAVLFDTFQDRRNGVEFMVSAIGGMLDALTTDERSSNRDWNTVWDAKTGRFDGGWAVEMVIPFKSLRYRAGRDQVWGLQFRRNIRHKNEIGFLTPMPAVWGMSAIFRVSRAATLVGLQVPPSRNQLEIKPYAVSDLRTDRLSSPAISNDPGADAGFDVKYGITKSLTLDLTYNTDFAQVEEDEAQVNLTRFSLFFPEKREFFLEGQGIFAFGGGTTTTGGQAGSIQSTTSVVPTLFFSRRVGLNQGRPVPIVGGARVTGRAGAFTVGALNIQTDAEPVAWAERTNFTVLRLRRDILGRSTIGALVTRRDGQLAGSNVVYGADGIFTFFQFLNLNTYVAKSQTPDLNGKDTSYRAQLNYSADRYGLQLERLGVGDNFNPEVGFMRRENFRRNFAEAKFSPRPRRSNVIRKYTYQGSLDYITDNDNTLESREFKGLFRIQLQNSDEVSAEYTRNYELIERPFTVSDSDGVRVPVGGYGFHSFKGTYDLGEQRRVSGATTLERGSFYDGDRTSVGFRGRAQIAVPLSIEPTISFNWLDLPQRSLLTKLISTRTTYTMTPRMYISALVQYSSTTTSLSTNLRFRWEYQPGSELFVVYTDARDTFPTNRIDLESRGLVVKINRLFRF